MDSIHICHKWSLASKGVSHVMPWTFFLLGIRYYSIVRVIMRRRRVSSERRRSSCSSLFFLHDVFSDYFFYEMNDFMFDTWSNVRSSWHVLYSSDILESLPPVTIKLFLPVYEYSYHNKLVSHSISILKIVISRKLLSVDVILYIPCMALLISMNG